MQHHWIKAELQARVKLELFLFWPNHFWLHLGRWWRWLTYHVIPVQINVSIRNTCKSGTQTMYILWLIKHLYTQSQYVSVLVWNVCSGHANYVLLSKVNHRVSNLLLKFCQIPKRWIIVPGTIFTLKYSYISEFLPNYSWHAVTCVHMDKTNSQAVIMVQLLMLCNESVSKLVL